MELIVRSAFKIIEAVSIFLSSFFFIHQLVMAATPPSSVKIPKSTKEESLNTVQWFTMLGFWKEHSLLNKTDGSFYKINTLNTVARLGIVHSFYNARLFYRIGGFFGQSENQSAVDDFSYFQRSVKITGAEFALGWNILREKEYSFGLSIGGLSRTIMHTVPNENYTFKTKTKALPQATLELMWQLSSNWYWRQSVGSQGQLLDTFWSIGLGYNLL